MEKIESREDFLNFLDNNKVAYSIDDALTDNVGQNPIYIYNDKSDCIRITDFDFVDYTVYLRENGLCRTATIENVITLIKEFYMIKVCRFCKSTPTCSFNDMEGLTHDIDLGVLGSAKSNTGIYNDSGILYIYNSLLTPDESLIDKFEKIPINYCPFCGRNVS